MGMAKIKVIIVLSICLLSTMEVRAQEIIRSIQFEGNKVTHESVMRREMYITEGDEFNIQRLERSVQAIMDLGLFKSVTYAISRSDDAGDSQIDITIVVEEKIYWYVLPRGKLEEDVPVYGAKLYLDNFLGLNHSVNAVYDVTHSSAGIRELRRTLDYYYPNFYGTRYALDFSIEEQNTVDENEPGGDVNRTSRRAHLYTVKWLNDDGRNHGYYASFGFGVERNFNDPLQTADATDIENANILGLAYGYKQVHEYEYSRGGKSIEYSIGVSDPAFGSDSIFTTHSFRYKSYYTFDSLPGRNLNVQTRIAHSTGNILGDDAFTLGNSNGLRGYDNHAFEGNDLLLVNVEYLTPSSFSPAFRYVYFWDIGNTYDQPRDLTSLALKSGIGFGVRWKIRFLVKVDIRLDVAWGVNDDTNHITLASRHAF